MKELGAKLKQMGQRVVARMSGGGEAQAEQTGTDGASSADVDRAGTSGSALGDNGGAVPEQDITASRVPSFPVPVSAGTSLDLEQPSGAIWSDVRSAQDSVGPSHGDSAAVDDVIATLGGLSVKAEPKARSTVREPAVPTAAAAAPSSAAAGPGGDAALPSGDSPAGVPMAEAVSDTAEVAGEAVTAAEQATIERLRNNNLQRLRDELNQLQVRVALVLAARVLATARITLQAWPCSVCVNASLLCYVCLLHYIINPCHRYAEAEIRDGRWFRRV